MSDTVIISILGIIGTCIAGFFTYISKKSETRKDEKLDKIVDMVQKNQANISLIDNRIEELTYQVAKGRLVRAVVKEITDIQANVLTYATDEQVRKHINMKFKNFIPFVEYVLTYYESIEKEEEMMTIAKTRLDVICREAEIDETIDFYNECHKEILPYIQTQMSEVMIIINDKINNNKIPRMGKHFVEYWKTCCKITLEKYNQIYFTKKIIEGENQ